MKLISSLRFGPTVQSSMFVALLVVQCGIAAPANAEPSLPFDPASCATPANTVTFALISGIEVVLPWPGVVPRLPPEGSYVQPEGPEPRGCPDNPWIVQAVAMPFFLFDIADEDVDLHRISESVRSIQIGGRTNGTANLNAGDARGFNLTKQMYGNCRDLGEASEVCFNCAASAEDPDICADGRKQARLRPFSVRIPLTDAESEAVFIRCHSARTETRHQPCSTFYVLRSGLSVSYNLDARYFDLENLEPLEREIREQIIDYIN